MNGVTHTAVVAVHHHHIAHEGKRLHITIAYTIGNINLHPFAVVNLAIVHTQPLRSFHMVIFAKVCSCHLRAFRWRSNNLATLFVDSHVVKHMALAVASGTRLTVLSQPQQGNVYLLHTFFMAKVISLQSVVFAELTFCFSSVMAMNNYLL